MIPADIIPFIIIPMALLVSVAYGGRVANHWQQTLLEVAQHFSWPYRKSGAWLEADELRADDRGFQITVEIVKSRSGKNSQRNTKVTVNPGNALLETLTLTREGIADRLGQLFGDTDIQLGVGHLDDHHNITGSESSVLALFNEPVRNILCRANLKNVHLREGRIECLERGYVKDSRVLIELIESMLDLGTALNGVGGTPQARLAYNLSHDPDHDYRRRCLEALFFYWPGAEQTLDAATLCLGDHEKTSMRLAAAAGVLALSNRRHFSSAAGHSSVCTQAVVVLEGIAQDPQVVDGQRADALTALVPHMGDQSEVARLLAKPLGSSPQARYFPRMAMRVMELAVSRKISLPFDLIEPYLSDDELAGAAAMALEFVVDARTSPALLRLLDNDDEDIAEKAAISLGRTGDISAVQTLLSRAEGILVGAELKRAARAAVALLQSRANKESAGGLTITDEGLEGGLSRPTSPMDEPAD